MNDKPIYPDIEAIAETDNYGNQIVVRDNMANGKRYEFTHRQWGEVTRAARQDLLMRIDNFERSPVPPPIITQAVVIHVPERNAVSVSNLDSEPSSYDFSAPQWKAICRATAGDLFDLLEWHKQQRKQEKGV